MSCIKIINDLIFTGEHNYESTIDYHTNNHGIRVYVHTVLGILV